MKNVKRVKRIRKQAKRLSPLFLLSAIICPDNCEDFDLPEVNFDDCAPQVFESQLAFLRFTKPGNPLTDWTDAAEWSGRLSNTSSDPDAIRSLTIIGGVPLPDKTEKVISGQRTVFLNKKRTLNFTVDELNDINYEAARKMQCITTVEFWFETIGGHLFGGNEGIKGSLDLDLELSDAAGELEVIKGTLKWDSKNMPERTLSPIA